MCIHSFNHACIHSLTNPLTHLCAHSLMHFTHSLIQKHMSYPRLCKLCMHSHTETMHLCILLESNSAEASSKPTKIVSLTSMTDRRHYGQTCFVLMLNHNIMGCFVTLHPDAALPLCVRVGPALFGLCLGCGSSHSILEGLPRICNGHQGLIIGVCQVDERTAGA